MGVGGIDDAAVHGALADLRGNLLHVVAVGQLICDGGLIDAVVVEDLQGILAHRHVAVADGQHHITVLQQLGKLVEALNALGIAFGNGERHLVFQQVHTAVGDDEVKPVGVLLGITDEAAVHGVHLLGGGGNEQVAVRALLDLGEQLARGIKVIGNGHVGIVLLVHFLELVHGLRHRGGCEHDQLHRLTGGGFRGGAVLRLGTVAGVGVGVGFTAAGGEGQGQAQGQQQGQILFHVGSSFLIRWKIYLGFTE